ncbi:Uncharacterized protein FKW44_017100 [Caligus rogercresseyi]|uniref:Uncharacterized protein n=1 Tax=Caligus rogercresseyi TaxID=217165 RepID=A0A7T8K0W2_CALRO|nr:Uncharacterized protein FKW44_017100 [Caligus rogercresseyi]
MGSMPYVQEVQDFCRAHISDFWPANMWPSSSPDLNPLDFFVRSDGKDPNKTSHTNLKALQQAICKAWDDMSEEIFATSAPASVTVLSCYRQ